MFDVTFWGVRGSIPVSNAKINRYGSNTSCVSANLDGKIIIFDTGTGICKLGDYFYELTGDTAIDADIFLSHYHIDHIEGFPFFSALFDEKSKINIYGVQKNGMQVGQIMDNFIRHPYYPFTLASMTADINFISINEYDSISINEIISIKTIPINHPGGCNSFRLEYCGKSMVYMTDIELSLCDYGEICSFVRDSDLLIFDVFFDDDYKNGWGHSTLCEATALANDTGVNKLALFHHSHMASDDKLAAMETKIKLLFENSFTPFEGQTVSLL